MFEEKLIAGRYIKLPISSLAAPPGEVGQFATLTPMNLTLKESTSFRANSTSVKAKSSDAVLGTSGRKMNRNFQFLHYVPGMVTEVPFNGIDVLTGPMSGCHIAVYKRNGVLCVGHIGTYMEPTSVKSLAAKQAWNDFAKDNSMHIQGGFQPVWMGGSPVALPEERPVAKLFALVTRDAFYAVSLFPQSNDSQHYRIAGIQRQQSVDVEVLKKL